MNTKDLSATAGFYSSVCNGIIQWNLCLMHIVTRRQLQANTVLSLQVPSLTVAVKRLL